MRTIRTCRRQWMTQCTLRVTGVSPRRSDGVSATARWLSPWPPRPHYVPDHPTGSTSIRLGGAMRVLQVRIPETMPPHI